MEPSVLYFLIINGVIFSSILIYLGIKKRFMKPKPNEEGYFNSDTGINREYYKQKKGTNKDYKQIQLELENREQMTDPTRPVNVVFTWNGHDWDAYEVLGVPAGSNLAEVKMAYEAALSRVDEPSRKIIEKAYRSICQKVS